MRENVIENAGGSSWVGEGGWVSNGMRCTFITGRGVDINACAALQNNAPRPQSGCGDIREANMTASRFTRFVAYSFGAGCHLQDGDTDA